MHACMAIHAYITIDITSKPECMYAWGGGGDKKCTENMKTPSNSEEYVHVIAPNTNSLKRTYIWILAV